MVLGGGAAEVSLGNQQLHRRQRQISAVRELSARVVVGSTRGNLVRGRAIVTEVALDAAARTGDAIRKGHDARADLAPPALIGLHHSRTHGGVQVVLMVQVEDQCACAGRGQGGQCARAEVGSEAGSAYGIAGVHQDHGVHLSGQRDSQRSNSRSKRSACLAMSSLRDSMSRSC